MHRSPQQSRNTRLIVTVLCYTLLLAYGTLYPLSGWSVPPHDGLNSVIPDWPDKLHTSDVIMNLLVYIPFGYLVALLFFRRNPMWVLLILATSMGTSLSFLLEYLQTYLPSRVASLSDMFLNGAGSLVGAAFVLLLNQSSSVQNSALQNKLLSFKQHWLKDDPTTHLGLAVLALWVLSQLLPLAPSLDVGTLRDGVRPVWRTINDLSLFNPWRTIFYALNIIALGMLTSMVLKPDRRVVLIFATFAAAVLLLKVPIIGRQLSAESLIGLTIGLASILVFRSIKISVPGTAAFAICVAFLIEVLSYTDHGITRQLNWIPFLGHMKNVMDLIDIVATIWPFTALAYLASLYTPQKPKKIAIIGGTIVFLITLALEWVQQYLPGRHPDITDVLLATIGWSLPWLYMNNTEASLK